MVSLFLYDALFFRMLNCVCQSEVSLSSTFNGLGMLFMFVFHGLLQLANGHELIHRQEKIYFAIASLHGVNLFALHFIYDHIYGHHKTVGTPADCGTAMKGERHY